MHVLQSEFGLVAGFIPGPGMRISNVNKVGRVVTRHFQLVGVCLYSSLYIIIWRVYWL